MPGGSTTYGWLAVFVLTAVTVLTRSFFLLPERDPKLPGWLWRGLRHAPVAALCAMVMPEVVLHQGHWPMDWRNVHLIAAAAALSYHLARPRDVLGTILAGTGTLLVLRLGLGWP